MTSPAAPLPCAHLASGMGSSRSYTKAVRFSMAATSSLGRGHARGASEWR